MTQGKAETEECQVPLEVYERLAKATPEEKTDIVLRLIEEHPEGKLELPERNGVWADLSKVDLSRDTLKAKLEQLKRELPPWWDADRECPHLSFANLQGASLIQANLQGAILSDANLQGASLIQANLQDAQLTKANLQGAILSDANLQGIWLWFANLQDAILSGANLQGGLLRRANLHGAFLLHANLQDADLRYAKLQEVDLYDCTITHIYLSGAWLDKTRLRWEQLGGAVGEELLHGYGQARQAYLALKQNFEDLGDYDAASWAYRKERRMEKLEAHQKARTALTERKWRAAARNYAEFLSDQLVEWVCDYGEGIWRMVGSLIIVWIGFALIYWLVAGVWGPWQDTDSGQVRYITRNPIDLLSFSLGAMVTLEPADLEARSTLIMRVLMPLEALLGIFLAGLLGFVVANRIRRS